MERRNFFMASLAAASFAAVLPKKIMALDGSDNSIVTGNSQFIKPKALKPGDVVGVIAPGTAVSDPEDLSRAKEVLDFFGLKMKLGKYLKAGSGYKSRTIKERLEDLHSMFADDEVKAVIAIRGGYGSAQLLDSIDYKLIKNNPKVFIGFSDITAMHLAINKISGLVTFHGPVLLSTFNEYTINYFKKAVFDTKPIGEAANTKTHSAFREDYPIRTVVKGKGKGKLVGGNLSIISSTLGTPYEIDTKGKIFFVEDVGEQPYRIDRMLTQLRLSGKLDEAAGIVVGYCKDCDYDVLRPSRVWDYSFGETIDDILGGLKIPVISGLTFGHTNNQLTLPLGIEAELDADLGTLNITESALI